MTERHSKFWDLMKSEVSLETFSSMLRLPNGKPGGSESPLDSHADEVLEYAMTEAKRRDKDLSEVLAEMGFNVDPALLGASPPPAMPASPDGSNAKKFTVYKTTVDRDVAPAARPSEVPQPGDPGDRIVAALAPTDAEDLMPILDGLHPDRGETKSKLAYLRLVDDHRLREAEADARHGGCWWKALLVAGVSPEDVAEIARSEPYFPPPDVDGQRFREFLLDHDLLIWRNSKVATQKAMELRRSYLEIAVEEGFVDKTQLFDAMVEFTGWERAPSAAISVDAELLGAFPIGWVQAFRVVPVARTEEHVVVAASFQLQGKLQARLETDLGAPVRVQLADEATIKKLQAKHLDRWGTEVEPSAQEDSGVSRMAAEHHASLRAAITQQSAVELVRKLVEGALQARATDIHLEPCGGNARVRYRIDGILHEVLSLESDLYDEVVARIKILSDLNITERRLPQDGHINLVIHDKPYDLRIASIPAKGGEKLAIRLADAGRGITSLEQLGLAEPAIATLRDLTVKPFGMVLATGPVGSGKTTTLYSCLGEIDRERRQVVSIEDPVEIELPGTNQVEVNYEIGFDFSTGLRALLRQDPDVILVGEVRDEETAKIAVRASMTGLLVFSTLHTNDSTGAVTALRNFHIPSHLIANSMQGVIAQRLLRQLCPHCKGPSRSKKIAAEHLGLAALPRGFKHFQGKGCKSCFNTGYVGRTGVFEIFTVDRTVRDMILEQASERSIRDYAIEHGMDTLQQDGLNKVMEGVTSAEEFKRVLRF